MTEFETGFYDAKNDLADGLSKNAVDDLVFTQKKEDNSMNIGM